MLKAAILDNSAVARGLLRTILANGGHDVVAESGITAMNLPRLVLLAPQLVFVSLDATEVDSPALLKALRSSLPKALIFAVSSAVTNEMIAYARENGANGFVVKPFNGTTVLSSIRSAVLKLVEQQRSNAKS